MNYKKMFKSIRYACFGQVHIKFLYNSKFDFTAKSLVTNTVVIARVLCIKLLNTSKSKEYTYRGSMFSGNVLTDWSFISACLMKKSSICLGLNSKSHSRVPRPTLYKLTIYRPINGPGGVDVCIFRFFGIHI